MNSGGVEKKKAPLPRRLPAALIASACLLQSCACLLKPSLQKIPVTSNPVGARVFVDDRELGSTPITLSLNRADGGEVRIEKEGYEPHNILITPGPSPIRVNTAAMIVISVPLGAAIGAGLGSVIGTVFINGPVAEAEHDRLAAVGWGALTGLVVVPIVVGNILHRAETSYPLSPAAVNVELRKKGEGTRPGITILSAEQWSRVRWIRIACADGTDER